MAEIKREVRSVEVNYLCDACGQGMRTQSGTMDPATGDIEHKGLICGHPQTFQWRAYPRIEHVGLDEKI